MVNSDPLTVVVTHVHIQTHTLSVNATGVCSCYQTQRWSQLLERSPACLHIQCDTFGYLSLTHTLPQRCNNSFCNTWTIKIINFQMWPLCEPFHLQVRPHSLKAYLTHNSFRCVSKLWELIRAQLCADSWSDTLRSALIRMGLFMFMCSFLTVDWHIVFLLWKLA